MNQQHAEAILVDYIRRNLSPTPEEITDISSKFKDLSRFLLDSVFQSGSYARFTSTTPVHDLDVIYVLPQSLRVMARKALVRPEELVMSDILSSLGDQLATEYAGIARVVVQTHSVGIFFGSEDQFSIDVVPAIAIEGGLFCVPEVAHLSVAKRRKIQESHGSVRWIKSHPNGYIKQARETDRMSAGRFRKTTKFVKKWKAACEEQDEHFQLKSFHSELLVTAVFRDNPNLLCLDALELFFSHLDGQIAEPHLIDLADSGTYVDQYVADLSSDETSRILRFREMAQDAVRELKSAETEAQVLRGIERLVCAAPSFAPGVAVITGRRSVEPAYSRPFCGG